MNVTERPLVFDCEGDKLVGVLAEAGASAKVGVLVVDSGWQYRVGSHRQFLLLSRRLALRGIATMRFDYRGTGDSSGDMRTFEEIDADIAAAIDAFVTACPSVEQVVLWGLCDAASASLLYWHGAGDARIGGMILLNPWVLSDHALARSQVKHHYRKRIFQGEFWTKLARGEVDVADALRTIAAAARGGADGTGSGAYQNFMAEALGSFDRPVLIILSGRDPTAAGFAEYCATQPRWRGLIDRPNVEQRCVPDADHTFSAAAWREAVETLTLEWLQRSFR